MSVEVQYIAVNRITRNGSSYEPGADIYLDPTSDDTKDLLSIKAIKEPGAVLAAPTLSTSGNDKLAEVNAQLADALNANNALQAKLEDANASLASAINTNTALQAQLDQANADLAAAKAAVPVAEAAAPAAAAPATDAPAGAPAAATPAADASAAAASTAPAADTAKAKK